MGIAAAPVHLRIHHAQFTQQGSPVFVGAVHVAEGHDPGRRLDVVLAGRGDAGDEETEGKQEDSGQAGHAMSSHKVNDSARRSPRQACCDCSR